MRAKPLIQPVVRDTAKTLDACNLSEHIVDTSSKTSLVKETQDLHPQNDPDLNRITIPIETNLVQQASLTNTKKRTVRREIGGNLALKNVKKAT